MIIATIIENSRSIERLRKRPARHEARIEAAQCRACRKCLVTLRDGMLRASDPLPHHRVAGGDVRIANTGGERGVAEEVVSYSDSGGRLPTSIPVALAEGHTDPRNPH